MTLHYVSHAAIPSSEANSVQVMKMCAALARRGADVVLHCRATGPLAGAHARYAVPESFALAPVASPRLRVAGRALHSLRLAGRLRGAGPGDLLYGRDYHTLALLARARGAAPLVLEVHQPPGTALERRLLRAVLASPRFLRLVVISEALRKEYERLFGALARGRTTVAHDGAEAPPAEPPPPPGRARLALGYVGNLYPGKGMERIEELAARLPELDFHVVGGAPDDVARWRARIRAPNATFHGHLPHAEAQARMRACDVLLAPFQPAVLIGGDGTDISRWMSPLKVFEYMASGRPMVASDLPVLREVLRDGENALLADPLDADAWVARIRRLAADEELRRALAARAAAELSARYTWDRRVERILAELGPAARAAGAGAGARERAAASGIP